MVPVGVLDGMDMVGGMSSTTTSGSTSTVHIGQLDLGMHGPTTKQLIWRGVVFKTLDPRPSQRSKKRHRQGCQETTEELSAQAEVITTGVAVYTRRAWIIRLA
jgi:hypothetical protein